MNNSAISATMITTNPIKALTNLN